MAKGSKHAVLSRVKKILSEPGKWGQGSLTRINGFGVERPNIEYIRESNNSGPCAIVEYDQCCLIGAICIARVELYGHVDDSVDGPFSYKNAEPFVPVINPCIYALVPKKEGLEEYLNEKLTAKDRTDLNLIWAFNDFDVIDLNKGYVTTQEDVLNVVDCAIAALDPADDEFDL